MSKTLMEKKVATVIEVIRPAIQADNGDIFLRHVDVETGVVQVELTGACISCPVSTITLKDGIERILKERIDGVTAVEHVGAELAGASGGTPVTIGGTGTNTMESTVVSPLAPPAVAG